ncbi:MAG TPA: hypothetical protein DEE98_04665 [Elusimicrobia bacterium]|nr:MAG: hypothetical protein A2278_04350 [Elusimicrobia bacterium RIFOXYA12_FULL_49_49]OGS08376.1 MAG: hypothetical protein A2204_03490 [Elusimicrobia bacterium RIFOXYA1_FULL_47_7]OGS10496.1 MAG: hypothetical protein A2386_05320 [Elusimicrobia bacterium RIFOXYB1_FULL_48_9]OGS14719.1 MAG: hypothetical protein A2251_09490 [Elusimicrobia bacterium RIFOXYA2_FULL_47_53]OGS25629.1 MAG: hypothetical protein A2339_06100 [Elusimicrobia bacterium RIFOXYB12_FULL_50_12]OGS31810.1 MAG: hypothetical protein
MPVQIIVYQGKKILYANYEGLKSAEKVMETLAEFESVLKSQKEKILVLANYKDTFVSPAFINQMKSLSKTVFPEKVEKSAVFGLDGMKKMLFQAYLVVTRDSMKAFGSEEEAKKYLIGS